MLIARNAGSRPERVADAAAHTLTDYRAMLWPCCSPDIRVHPLSVYSFSPKAIRCPVLCIGAGGDRVVPPAAAGQIAEATNGELVVFPGHGHWLIAGSLVSTVAATVAEWLERNFDRKVDGVK